MELPVEEQIAHLFEHVGIKQAHLVANLPSDYRPFVATYPERVASLTLICPRGLTAEVLQQVTVPLLVITGEDGPVNSELYPLITGRRDRSLLILSGYQYRIWSDVIVDREEEIRRALFAFLHRFTSQEMAAPTIGDGAEGEVNTIRYHIHGAGVPLMLFPMGLAPSQWEPLLSTPSQGFSLISLGGKSLGQVSVLERRGRSPSYLGAVGNVIRNAEIRPNDHVLEVGCGTGVLMRWLARQMNDPIQITAVDINRHFLAEAARFARQEGLEGRIDFREGHAEALPFADNTFDVTISSTVLEEVDADRALAEMVRVTKPGGRVAILVRSQDLQRFINLPLPKELRSRLEAPGAWGAGVGPKGCADASLYQRMARAGLNDLKRLPQLAATDRAEDLQFTEVNVAPLLSADELSTWRAAVATATSEGSYFVLMPYHGAVGTKG